MTVLHRRYGHAVNPELEAYRKGAVETLKRNGAFIRDTAKAVLGDCRGVYVIGSVLDPKRFREDSDVDIAVSVRGTGGLSESLSERLQTEMIRHPLGDVGVVNTVVFEGKVSPKIGKALKIA